MPSPQHQSNSDAARIAQAAAARARRNAEQRDASQTSNINDFRQAMDELAPGHITQKQWLFLVSFICLGVSGSMLFSGMVTGVAAALFYCALLAVGAGGLASLFGGTAKVSLGRWGKFTGVIALILALLLIFLQAFKLIDIRNLSALSMQHYAVAASALE
jgi:hypothetical protein